MRLVFRAKRFTKPWGNPIKQVDELVPRRDANL
jgi:hypothetical protein